MCASYSGKCIISNYTAGRDSNRGGCVQSCRHNFELQDNTLPDSSYIMNAKDLMGVSLIESYIKNGIDAVKIEGRMKSPLYVANASAQYRQAIDTVYNQINAIPSTQKAAYSLSKNQDNLQEVSNRGFSSGGLEERPNSNTISSTWNGYKKSVDYIGIIKSSTKPTAPYYFLEVKTPFHHKDPLWILNQNGESRQLDRCSIHNVDGDPLTHIQANQVVQLKSNTPLDTHAVIKRVLS